VIYGVTVQTRVVVGRLERGEWLHEALLEVARLEEVDAAFVRGHGTVEQAVLHAYDPASRGYVLEEEIASAAELASLSGAISLRDGKPDVRLHATVARPAEAGGLPLVAAGLLASARAVVVELALDVYDGGDLERRDDPATGLALWRPPFPGEGRGRRRGWFRGGPSRA
jgi:predicted DNA-binding protein with PD1-like motif